MSFHTVCIYIPTQVLYNNNVFINKQTVNEVKMRILICDDDPLMIEQLKKYCKNFFDKIHVKCPELACFSDGESLLADKGDKDILFLDIEMPGMNGIYVGNELKRANSSIIIFIVKTIIPAAFPWLAMLLSPSNSSTTESLSIQASMTAVLEMEFICSHVEFYDNQK